MSDMGIRNLDLVGMRDNCCSSMFHLLKKPTLRVARQSNPHYGLAAEQLFLSEHVIDSFLAISWRPAL